MEPLVALAAPIDALDLGSSSSLWWENPALEARPGTLTLTSLFLCLGVTCLTHPFIMEVLQVYLVWNSLTLYKWWQMESTEHTFLGWCLCFKAPVQEPVCNLKPFFLVDYWCPDNGQGVWPAPMRCRQLLAETVWQGLCKRNWGIETKKNLRLKCAWTLFKGKDYFNGVIEH